MFCSTVFSCLKDGLTKLSRSIVLKRQTGLSNSKGLLIILIFPLTNLSISIVFPVKMFNPKRFPSLHSFFLKKKVYDLENCHFESLKYSVKSTMQLNNFKLMLAEKHATDIRSTEGFPSSLSPLHPTK